MSCSISSISFFKYTKFAVLSFILLLKFIVFSPGGNINFIQSDMFEKYLFAINFASSIFSSVSTLSSIFTISLFANFDSCFMPIIYPSLVEFLGPNGTKTLLPIFTFFIKLSGII